MNEGLEKLIQSADAEGALLRKTDAEVADLLLEHVWADMSVLDLRGVLLSAAIDRLRRANGPAMPLDEEPA